MTDTAIPPAVTAYLERSGARGAQVVPLTGDASDRRYFRIRAPQRDPFVLAVHVAPFAPGSLPFVNVAELFGKMGVPIPAVRGEAGDLGILELDDLGDVTLQAHLGAAAPSEWRRMYEEAVRLIGVLQERGRTCTDARFLPYGIAFDTTKLIWELDFFIKHFLEAYRGLTLTTSSRESLRSTFTSLAEELASEPRVLCHRDYHSRNLMVHGGRLFVIDFQDARMGPDTYDLVSLLRDSYVDVPDDLVEDLVSTFVRATQPNGDVRTFRQRFDLMALQRNLKALGTFGYQATSRANPVYAQYVPRTLRYVRENLARHDRFAELRNVLAEHVMELQP